MSEIQRWEPEDTIVGYNMKPCADGSFVLFDVSSKVEAALRQQLADVSNERDGLREDLFCLKRNLEIVSADRQLHKDLKQEARAKRDELRRRLNASEARNSELEAMLDTPHTSEWFEGVKLEAGHQIKRWGADHDAGKAPADWFWLVGYLAGKALTANLTGNDEKARHHTISTGAALLNWFRAITGDSNVMRPSIAQSAPATDEQSGKIFEARTSKSAKAPEGLRGEQIVEVHGGGFQQVARVDCTGWRHVEKWRIADAEPATDEQGVE